MTKPNRGPGGRWLHISPRSCGNPFASWRGYILMMSSDSIQWYLACKCAEIWMMILQLLCKNLKPILVYLYKLHTFEGFETRKPLQRSQSKRIQMDVESASFPMLSLDLFRGRQTQNAGLHRDMVAKIVDVSMPYEIKRRSKKPLSIAKAEKHCSIAVS